jgi:hypothetical protein
LLSVLSLPARSGLSPSFKTVTDRSNTVLREPLVLPRGDHFGSGAQHACWLHLSASGPGVAGAPRPLRTPVSLQIGVAVNRSPWFTPGWWQTVQFLVVGHGAAADDGNTGNRNLIANSAWLRRRRRPFRRRRRVGVSISTQRYHGFNAVGTHMEGRQFDSLEQAGTGACRMTSTGSVSTMISGS